MHSVISPLSVRQEHWLCIHMLAHPDDVATVLGVIQAYDFHDRTHRAVFEAIREIDESGQQADIVAVSRIVKGIDPLKYISEELLPLGYHLSSLVDAVRDASHRRQLWQLGEDTQSHAASTHAEVSDTIEAIRDQAEGILAEQPSKLYGPLAVAKEIIARFEDEDLDPGIATGFPGIDELTNGLMPGRMYVIAARPSLGKSTLLKDMAANIASSGTPTLFASAEMDRTEIVTNIVAARERINAHSLTRRRLSDSESERFVAGLAAMRDWPLFIADEPPLSVARIRSLARQLHRKNDRLVVFVDYLQLLDPPRELLSASREQQVSHMSRKLKQLARELRIPVVVAAQINRDVDKGGARANGKPRMADLRESGAIEQDADVIGFLWDPNGIATTSREEMGETMDMMSLWPKNRQGPTGVAPLKWHRWCLSYVDASNQTANAYLDRPPTKPDQANGHLHHLPNRIPDYTESAADWTDQF